MHWLKAFRQRLFELRRDARLVGFRVSLILHVVDVYNRHRPDGRGAWRPLIRAKVRPFQAPVWLRAGTTDFRVLQQVAAEREYAALPGGFTSIVDCGAYVGFSSLYFLNRYPEAVVLAVEPDAENAMMCRANVAPYRGRVRLIEAAVWSESGRMALVRGEYRDGREWSNYVRPLAGDTDRGSAGADRAAINPAVRAVDVPALLDIIGTDTIDLLKIDIERGEIAVFGPGAQAWLPRVRNIAIELHDEECERAFFTALSSYDYDLRRSGELTLCCGIRPQPVPERLELHTQPC